MDRCRCHTVVVGLFLQLVVARRAGAVLDAERGAVAVVFGRRCHQVATDKQQLFIVNQHPTHNNCTVVLRKWSSSSPSGSITSISARANVMCSHWPRFVSEPAFGMMCSTL
eukprot:TRINITY_DN53015_c0_g1_i1.p2 TRINITY_DN53015_c0_g1~~TRINITY_DN53015_c0_g1_i1.p2  ORF type:complete len:111 (-),score=13.16 TRINITY_DN53015_c0_g1_i1:907-1239(-)